MKIILCIEGKVRENSYYIALKRNFPNLVAASTPQTLISEVYRSPYEDVLLILDEDFLIEAVKTNSLFKETIRGLTRNNGTRAYFIVFAKPDKHFLGAFHYGMDLLIYTPVKPAKLPQRIRGFLRYNRIK